MPTPLEFKTPFYPSCYYHLVCKSIDGLVLFKEDIDYNVFLQRFQQFTNDVLDVWSYCLLTNHTHHVVRVKPLAIIEQNIKKRGTQTEAMKKLLLDHNNESYFDSMIERQMNSFLVSFANYTNNKYNRKGGLFQKPFKRIQVDDDIHLQQAIIYVHANTQKHQIDHDFKKHPHISYKAILNNDTAFIDVKNVIRFFGGSEKLVSVHESQVDFYYNNNWPDSKLE